MPFNLLQKSRYCMFDTVTITFANVQYTHWHIITNTLISGVICECAHVIISTDDHV